MWLDLIQVVKGDFGAKTVYQKRRKSVSRMQNSSTPEVLVCCPALWIPGFLVLVIYMS